MKWPLPNFNLVKNVLTLTLKITSVTIKVAAFAFLQLSISISAKYRWRHMFKTIYFLFQSFLLCNMKSLIVWISLISAKISKNTSEIPMMHAHSTSSAVLPNAERLIREESRSIAQREERSPGNEVDAHKEHDKTLSYQQCVNAFKTVQHF